MKKAVLIFLSLVTVFALAACGGSAGGGDASDSPGKAQQSEKPPTVGGDKTPDPGTNTGGDDSGGDLTASIVPANGWVKIESASEPMYSYEDTAAAPEAKIYITTTVNILGENDAEFAANQLETDKLVNKHLSPVYTDITDVSINGYSAKEFTSETDAGQVIRKIMVVKEKTVFIVTCQAMKDSLDVVKQDFETMLASFTLK